MMVTCQILHYVQFEYVATEVTSFFLVHSHTNRLYNLDTAENNLNSMTTIRHNRAFSYSDRAVFSVPPVARTSSQTTTRSGLYEGAIR